MLIYILTSVLCAPTNRFVYHGESESDDTNSSVSTVVSKGGAASAGGKSNCGGGAVMLDRVLEPFMLLEREISSSASVGDDQGLYEKLAAVAGEDRGLPPKPLPRKEVVRPVKKKQPPPPADPVAAPDVVPVPLPPPSPPPAYHRLPPRLVDFVHKDESQEVAENADAALVSMGRQDDDDA